MRKPFFSREKERFSRFPKKSECRLNKILKIFFGERKGVTVTLLPILYEEGRKTPSLCRPAKTLSYSQTH
ncbi:MAG: hypothetical protein A2007_01265 [Verrucomicrobia bacterium GWC2_42_7]|nr:MAG: hypothetical protein A2007_01265 [Verrucomicrobia bacterium GWC2_42_7]